MTQDELKQQAAIRALDYVIEGEIVGVGTGSTANFFIDGLATIKDRIPGAVASSEASARRLTSHGIRLFDMNEVETLPVYIDGADEIDASLAMIKGGGGAQTREKIIAAVAGRFVCICDASKKVARLGRFPLPVEVIPMARAQVARQLARLGGRPVLRKDFVTDNGNLILDVHDLVIDDAAGLEISIDGIVGVVTSGLFAKRGADVLLLATANGVETYARS